MFLTERNFFVSETKSTWTEMGSVCLVGEPSFRFLSGTNVVGNVSISDIENNGVWVGYFEVMEYFYYIGMLKISLLTLPRSLNDIADVYNPSPFT